MTLARRLWRAIRAARETISQRQAHALATFGGALIVAITVLYFIQLNTRIDAAIHAAKQSAQNLAEVLAEHTARTFEALERVLHQGEAIRRDEETGRYATAGAARAALRHLEKSSPAIIALGWTDADGNLKVHTYERDPPRPSIADLPHFTEQRHAKGGNFFVSPPLRSAATGRWISAVSRRVNNDDGSFAGVITAPLDQDYFNGIYRLLQLGRNGSVVLVHAGGMVLTRVPFAANAVGRSFSDSPLFTQRIPQSPSGAYESASPVDGTHRVFGYKVVSGLPLVVIVTFDRSEVLQPLFRQVRTFGPIVALLVLSILVGNIFLIRQAREIAAKTSMIETTLDNIDEGLIMVDARGTLPIANRRARELLGLPDELMASRPTAEQVAAFQAQQGEFDDTPADVRQRLLPRIHGESPGIYERQRPNGAILQIRTAPLPGGGVVRTYTDVTPQRVAEKAFRMEKERAEAAARAKTEFLENMSHELRTPLTTIIGVSDLLLAGSQTAEDRRRFLSIQLLAGQGLLALINDVLDISKIEAGQLTIETVPIPVRDKVRNCLTLVAEQARAKKLELIASVAADVPERVMADPIRLRQVLLNLLSNAVKFTASGSITLSVEAMTGSRNVLRFAVTDTGIGIAPEKLPLLFERFTQADSSTTRQYGGSGLGLAISKRLVELMGGVLKVQSTPERGSTFSFALNLERLPETNVQAASQTHTLDDRAYRILLAEDNDLNRQLIAAVLRQAGHQVVTAANGVQAIDAAMETSFDVILMDMQMPEMDGYMTARAIRAAAHEGGTRVPIIALTANVLVDEAERCRNAGMDFYAPKPVDWPRLFAAIDRLVARTARVAAQPLRAAAALDGNAPVLEAAKLAELRRLIGEANAAQLVRMFEIDARQRFVIAPEFPDALRAVAEEAHSFGGTAAMLGFAELAQACQALSASAGRGEPLTALLARCRAARDRAVTQAENLRELSAAGVPEARA